MEFKDTGLWDIVRGYAQAKHNKNFLKNVFI